MWSNFLYTNRVNRCTGSHLALDAIHRCTGPNLLSTQAIVSRGRPCSRRTRSTVSCGRTSSRQIAYDNEPKCLPNRKTYNSKAAALTECLTRWGQIYTKVYFLFVCVFSCFCLLCLEIWSGHIYTRGLHAYPHHCLCILRSVGWQPTLSPH
jgi:hypothetical protein